MNRILNAVLRSDPGELERCLRLFPERINEVDTHHRTALIHAVIQKGEKLVDLLIKSKCDPNKQDKAGNCPLHYSAQNYTPNILKMLLGSGASVDLGDEHGNSPLFRAVFNSQGRGEIITLLLKADADRDLKNFYGVSPLELAQTIGNYNVKQFLE
ncbi:MAG TPA: ankyrin repeat domain-containing protein [Verrucomicrobiales bacterium]|nr:ankyrin repeat domain-containing protein [Verrucomicrobiales bacterium]